MNILVPILLVLLLVLFWRARKSRTDSSDAKKPVNQKKPKSSVENTSSRSPFAAVSIKAAGDPCPAVCEVEGLKFLKMEAPITPLPECSNPKCKCKYVHYDDRRSLEDRRDPMERGRSSYEARGLADRRSKHDRRRVDSTVNSSEPGYDELLGAAVEESARLK
jgi:hypothetical protein